MFVAGSFFHGADPSHLVDDEYAGGFGDVIDDHRKFGQLAGGVFGGGRGRSWRKDCHKEGLGTAGADDAGDDAPRDEVVGDIPASGEGFDFAAEIGTVGRTIPEIENGEHAGAVGGLDLLRDVRSRGRSPPEIGESHCGEDSNQHPDKDAFGTRQNGGQWFHISKSSHSSGCEIR